MNNMGRICVRFIKSAQYSVRHKQVMDPPMPGPGSADAGSRGSIVHFADPTGPIALSVKP